MRYTFFTMGSRGDTQPYVALGRALLELGQAVTICAPENFGPLVQGLGLDFAPLPWNTREALKDQGLMQRLASDDVAGFFIRVQRLLVERQREFMDAWLAAAQGADVLVGASTTDEGLTLMGRNLNKAVLYTELSPLTPSSAYAPIITGTDSLGPLNSLAHWLTRQVWWRINRPALAGLEKAAGRSAPQLAPSLEALRRGAKVLHGFSPALFAPPRDWGADAHYTGGAWRLSPGDAQRLRGDHQDAGFTAWLEDGSPPVFLSFGSMPAMAGGELLELAGDVAEALDLRVVLGAGWTDVDGPDCDLPEGVAVCGDCDHGWLLERCCAVVHHGGAGTTHTAAASGLPQVVCPLFADQPFWAGRVRRLGVAKVLPYKRLDAGALSEALADALQGPCQEAAAALAERVRQEDGAAGAARRMVEWGLG